MSIYFIICGAILVWQYFGMRGDVYRLQLPLIDDNIITMVVASTVCKFALVLGLFMIALGSFVLIAKMRNNAETEYKLGITDWILLVSVGILCLLTML